MSLPKVSAAAIAQAQRENDLFDAIDRSGDPLERYAEVREKQVQFGTIEHTHFCDNRVIELVGEEISPGIAKYTNEFVNEMMDLMLQYDVVTKTRKVKVKLREGFDAPSHLAIRNGIRSTPTFKFYRATKLQLGLSSNSSIWLDFWPDSTISNQHPSKTRANSVYPELLKTLETNSIVHIYGSSFVAETLVPNLTGVTRTLATSKIKSHFVQVGNHPGVINRDKEYWEEKITKQMVTSISIYDKFTEGGDASQSAIDSLIGEISSAPSDDFLATEVFKPTSKELTMLKWTSESRRGNANFGSIAFFNQAVICMCEDCDECGEHSERKVRLIRDWGMKGVDQRFLHVPKGKCDNADGITFCWETKIDLGLPCKTLIATMAYDYAKEDGTPRNHGVDNKVERMAAIKGDNRAATASAAEEMQALLFGSTQSPQNTSSSASSSSIAGGIRASPHASSNDAGPSKKKRISSGDLDMEDKDNNKKKKKHQASVKGKGRGKGEGKGKGKA